MADVKFIPILADLFVASKNHIMPPKETWKSPMTGIDKGKNYIDGVGMTKWGPQNNYEAADGVRTYFRTQDPHKYHKQTADEMTDTYKKFIHTMIDATEDAFNKWRKTLAFSNLKINGPCVVGSKGCLSAKMKFETLFKAYHGHSKISGGQNFNAWQDAVAKGVDQCLNNYIDNVMVPGLPWYPAFAVYPAPFAGPLPNIPWPLITCVSSGLPDITVAKKLQDAMLKNFDNSLKEKCPDKIHETVFMAIATPLSIGFLLWVSTQLITQVLGQGQVPSYSLPFTPAGPVVNGMNLPGVHLTA